jgi:hypothetical protein
VEYRPSYTYNTDHLSAGIIPFHYDNWYFKGLNNELLFYYQSNSHIKHGVILLQRYWWYDKKDIVNQEVHLYSGSGDWPVFRETRSTYMFGVGMGYEYLIELGTGKFASHFYVNITWTQFVAHSNVFGYQNNHVPNAAVAQAFPVPRREQDTRSHLNITLGFKFGIKKVRGDRASDKITPP